MEEKKTRNPMSEERRVYLQQYKKEHFKRVPLDVTPEFLTAIKSAAKANKMSVNGFIRWLLGMYLVKMGFLENSEN